MENTRLLPDPPDDMQKTSPYVRTIVGLHNLRDRAKEAVDSLNEKGIQERLQEGWNQTQTAIKEKTRSICKHPENVTLKHIPQQYGYVFRPKSYLELILLGGTVCGIEFCYAAETAFVTPLLLSLGLNIKFVTMIWCLSPMIGLFLTPILGSMSDSCKSRIGRRRPFIILYSIGIIAGLILVPNGHLIGLALGDAENTLSASSTFYSYNTTNDTLESSDELLDAPQLNKENTHYFNALGSAIKRFSNITETGSKEAIHDSSGFESSNSSVISQRRKRYVRQQDYLTMKTHNLSRNTETTSHIQPWSIAFTVIGTIFLDFCADACQSPSRTYMLDVSLPEDHAAGLTTFTSMAGLGGSLGYLMGAIQWNETFLGKLLGSQVSVVFTIVTLVFVLCLIFTLTSFPEIPLKVLRDPVMFQEYQEKLNDQSWKGKGDEMAVMDEKIATYGATDKNNGFQNDPEESVTNVDDVAQILPQKSTTENGLVPEIDVAAELTTAEQHPTLLDFLKSIVHMPCSLKVLCLTNLFCWMSLVSYSLYFSDFVAECVFGGDPTAPVDTEEHVLYESGIRFACWGMALYSFACAVYSYFIEALVFKIGAKPVYIGGQMVYSLGMVAMAITRHKVAVILLSPTAGVMYATLFTMPYLLIAHYHSINKFSAKGGNSSVRGIGTDIAAVSSMVFLSQLILSASMGTIVEAVGSNVATVCAAAVLSACGAIAATQVTYLDI